MPDDRPVRPAPVIVILILLALVAAALAAARTASTATATPPDGEHATRPVVVLEMEGPIGPAGSDYVVRGLAKAAETKAALVVLQLDTPGGLDTSMRAIVRAVLASPIPVAAFVAPGGARAASAGTYILYASHVAAMAPGTNIGAATPVQMGGPEDGAPPARERSGNKPEGEPAPALPGIAEKAVNDAVAYIRSLAEMRGRNVEWAEAAVRRAASLSAEQALKLQVIDVIAPDVPALLRAVDGRRVTTASGSVRLVTAGAAIVPQPTDWRTKLLSVITNPNVAALLMLIGVYALIFEFYSPGLIGPGVVGAVCILLALYAFHVLPVDYGGLALLLLGIALMIAEAFVGAFGVLGVGGLIAFVLGSIMLMPNEVPGFTVAWELLGSIALFLGVTFIALSALVLRARRRPVVAGREQMLGSRGPVVDWGTGEGRVRVHGEVWHARSPQRLTTGQPVRVTGIDGLTLQVEPDEPASRQARR